MELRQLRHFLALVDPISCPVLAVGAAVIPASGHNIALENPAALAQAYLDFFSPDQAR
jgi:hypothetical protein